MQFENAVNHVMGRRNERRAIYQDGSGVHWTVARLEARAQSHENLVTNLEAWRQDCQESRVDLQYNLQYNDERFPQFLQHAEKHGIDVTVVDWGLDWTGDSSQSAASHH